MKKWKVRNLVNSNWKRSNNKEGTLYIMLPKLSVHFYSYKSSSRVKLTVLLPNQVLLQYKNGSWGGCSV